MHCDTFLQSALSPKSIPYLAEAVLVFSVFFFASMINNVVLKPLIAIHLFKFFHFLIYLILSLIYILTM